MADTPGEPIKPRNIHDIKLPRSGILHRLPVKRNTGDRKSGMPYRKAERLRYYADPLDEERLRSCPIANPNPARITSGIVMFPPIALPRWPMMCRLTETRSEPK